MDPNNTTPTDSNQTGSIPPSEPGNPMSPSFPDAAGLGSAVGEQAPSAGFSAMPQPSEPLPVAPVPAPADLGNSFNTPAAPTDSNPAVPSAPPTDFSSWQPAGSPPPAAPAFGSSIPNVPQEIGSPAPSESAPSGFSISDLAGGSPAPSLGGLSSAPPASGLGEVVNNPALSDSASIPFGSTTNDSPSPLSPMGGSANPESAAANPFMTSSSMDTMVGSSSAPAVDAAPVLDPVGITESAPTDLSHLVSGGATGEVPAASTIPQPETLVVSPAPTSQDAQVVTGSGSHGFPKWIFAVGGLVLLLVVLGSAYFILGVGKSEQATTSVPAVQQPLTNPPKAILPTTVPTESPATGSAGFGGLGGNTVAPTSSAGTSSAQTNGGASALELLRQRQGNNTTP